MHLRQSTASQEVPLGYFVDSTDGNTEETALTINNTDIKLWKNGATTLANKNSGGATHISNGIYYATLDATDTDTTGPLVIFVHITGSLPVRAEFEVLPPQVYDSLVPGTDYLQTHAVEISNNLITANAIATGAVDADAVAADAAVEIAAAVWDRVLTGATHNITNSAGRRLRTLDAITAHDGTAQAGANNSITLSSGASSTDRLYNFDLITIVGGTGAGQSRLIIDYNGTSKVATVNRNWRVNPDNTSDYVVIGKSELLISNGGLAQAGASTSITLNSIASSTNDDYVGSTVEILTGSGSGQTRIITAYNGTTKVATVNTAWEVNPDTTSAYVVLPFGRSLLIGLASSGESGIRSAVGLITANLDTTLNAIDDHIATETGIIQAKTNSLTFTTAGQVDANIQSVNDVALTGNGSSTPWGPA